MFRFFTLASVSRDVAFIDPGGGRGPADRLGLAGALCTLPWLGFVPDDVAAAPSVAVARLADQLGVDPDVTPCTTRPEAAAFAHDPAELLLRPLPVLTNAEAGHSQHEMLSAQARTTCLGDTALSNTCSIRLRPGPTTSSATAWAGHPHQW